MQIRGVLRTALFLSLMSAAAANASTLTLSRCIGDSDPCSLSLPDPAFVARETRLEPGANIELVAGEIRVVRGANFDLGANLVLSPGRGVLQPLDDSNNRYESHAPRKGGQIQIRDDRDGLPSLQVTNWGHESRNWTQADALQFVKDWAWRHHERDFDEFRRWRHEHGHHDRGDCDDDLPKPVPLPGAALLFGPALLMLRAVQRRNA
ncbi:MAG: hypothetical protein HZA64_12295 [Rhodocyclales bacterium]|nr:hypothetical protein [Rhodocyclales bacterium]MBI5786227.1 hypothetical protein [Rhodocyclales bacterium]